MRAVQVFVGFLSQSSRLFFERAGRFLAQSARQFSSQLVSLAGINLATCQASRSRIPCHRLIMRAGWLPSHLRLRVGLIAR